MRTKRKNKIMRSKSEFMVHIEPDHPNWKKAKKNDKVNTHKLIIYVFSLNKLYLIFHVRRERKRNPLYMTRGI